MHLFCPFGAADLGLLSLPHGFTLTLRPVCAEELGLDCRQQQPGPAPGLLGVRLADTYLHAWQAWGEYIK